MGDACTIYCREGSLQKRAKVSRHRGCIGEKHVEVDRGGVVGRYHFKQSGNCGSFYHSGKGQDQFVGLAVDGRSKQDRQPLFTERYDTRDDVHRFLGAGPVIEQLVSSSIVAA